MQPKLFSGMETKKSMHFFDLMVVNIKITFLGLFEIFVAIFMLIKYVKCMSNHVSERFVVQNTQMKINVLSDKLQLPLFFPNVLCYVSIHNL